MIVKVNVIKIKVTKKGISIKLGLDIPCESKKKGTK